MTAILTAAMIVGCGGGAGGAGGAAPAGGSSQQASGGAEGGGAAGAVTFNIGSSSSGAFYYVATAMGQVLTPVLEEYGVTVVGEATNGSVENLRRLQAGELQMAMCAPSNLLDEINAGNVNKEDVAVIVPLYPNTYHLMAQPSLGIETVQDLFDLIPQQKLSFGIGEPGAGLQTLWEVVLNSGGYTRDDVNAEQIGTSEFVDKFIDGDIDIMKIDSPDPAANVTNVITSRPDGAQILSWSAERQAAINEVDPYIVPDVIKGGIYDGYDEDIDTVCFYPPLMCRADLDEEQVYQFTKAMFENMDEMVKIFQPMSFIAPENMQLYYEAYTADGIAIHPGALRYYQEIGVLD